MDDEERSTRMLDIPHDEPLSRLAGLEEAPEEDIEQEQEHIRDAPGSSGESTGPNLAQQR